MKQPYYEKSTTKRIGALHFGMLSADEMSCTALIECTEMNLYDEKHKPCVGGVLDRRLGISKSERECPSCKLNFEECLGHFGVITLELPVYHIGFATSIRQVLHTICKTCSKVLLPSVEKDKYRAILERPFITYMQKKHYRRAIYLKCRKISECPHCGAVNGNIRKVGLLKFIHERLKVRKGKNEKFLKDMETAFSLNDEIPQANVQESLNPLIALQLFRQIPSEDILFLLMNREKCRPEDMILQKILVPPTCIRPSVISEVRAGTREDDLTKNAKMSTIQDDWDYLSLQCALYINSQTPGIPLQHQPKSGVRTLVQRLKGKQGRFRGNLSGKRVDFSGRSVISPDPNLSIEQVGVPIEIARNMTYPEKVTPHNKLRLQEMIINGPKCWPGANYVEKLQSDNVREVKFLGYGKREEVARKLRHGDTVLRHMIHGDWVLFNRQPSLHRLSIMAHQAKIMPLRTLRFNECVCNPYNADFDGDEMNIHLPQTEEARAEAAILMASKSNVITPKNGDLLIAATQDFITAAYLLTHKDTFFDRVQFCQLAASILTGRDSKLKLHIPEPAIQHPVRLWTGKQLFSLLICPSLKSKIRLNIRCGTKQYKALRGPDGKELFEMVADDTYVVVFNSQLVAGTLEKGTLSSGSKRNLFYAMLSDYSTSAASRLMLRLCRVAAVYLPMRGFSIGIGDVSPDLNLRNGMEVLIKKGNDQCDEFIDQANRGQLTCSPGCNLDQTLEAKILHELSTVRDEGGKLCRNTLPLTNSPLIMSLAGSKGSFINICQMVACVGQQAISGQRVANGFQARSLPHFARNDKTPSARGFVANSFFSGMTPTEFFFHTMAGREGLVDTAVKTAETGYMQRRLVKSLEDLCIAYDGSVRTRDGVVVQLEYGGDGLDPPNLFDNTKPIDLERIWYHCINEKHETSPLTSCDLTNVALKAIQPYVHEIPQWFRDQISTFISAKSSQITKRQQIEDVHVVQFIKEVCCRFRNAKIDPGTPVGALCAQSIGEPATQMTLKTFHFAGVASMNITQGVPRIKELINAVKNPSTPLIEAHLTAEYESDSSRAREVKGRVEVTRLGDISASFEEVYASMEKFVLITLDMSRIRLLSLEVDPVSVAAAINEQLSKVAVATPTGTETLIVETTDPFALLSRLPKVIVAGFATRAVINAENNVCRLLVEGGSLRNVLAVRGVNGSKTSSNHPLDVEVSLGIEAARTVLAKEMTNTMGSHGLSVDARHIALLADAMTFQGSIYGCTRQGLAKMKDSVLMLASFELTANHLFEAAYHGQLETVTGGVTESIITGAPVSLGTGIFKLLQSFPEENTSIPLTPRKVLFENSDFHIPESGL